MAFSQYLADRILTWVKGVSFPAALSNVHISIHSGNPGVNGTVDDATTSVTGTANRTTVASSAFSAVGNASGGGREITNSYVVQITTNAANGSTVTLTHFGVWDAVTGGNFLASGELTTPVSVQQGDTVQFNVGAMAIRVI
jgi:hypothetical protein